MPDIDRLYFGLLIITLIIAFAKLNRVKRYALIPWMLLILLSINLIATFIKANHENNLFLYHIWTPVEYTFIAIIYYKNIHRASIRSFIAWSIPLVIIVSIYLTAYIEGPKENNSYAGIICNLLTIFLALFYLYELLLSSTVKRFQYHPLCWFSIGLLMFNCGNLVTQGPLNYLMSKDMKIATLVYQISYIFSLLYFVSIMAASYFGSKENVSYE